MINYLSNSHILDVRLIEMSLDKNSMGLGLILVC